MAIMTIMKAVKEIHPESIALVKVGKFYNAYGKDELVKISVVRPCRLYSLVGGNPT